MHQNDILTLPVLDMNSEGTGICKQNGAVIFVPRTVTGDTIRLRIQSIQKNFCTAECLEIVTPSPNRRTPDCPWYESCGGCTLRHVTRETELAVKENTVRQALRRMHLEIEEKNVRPILYTEACGYRNKAIFHFDIRGRLGYYARESHTVMPGSTECRLLPEIFTEIAGFTEAYLRKNASKLYPETLYLRRNEKQDCTVTVQTEKPLTEFVRNTLQAYAEALKQRFPESVCGVLHSDHPKGKYAVPRYTVISGERYLYETCHGIRQRISPEGFCQVNHRGAEILAETVLGFIKESAPEITGRTAADLYCGSGFFGLHLAKALPDWQIYGVEINPESIRDAESNREQNELKNIRFRCGDAADLTEKEKITPTIVVIDPPRAGCSEKMCEQIARMMPDMVVYVSCNPQTLVRDLVRFCEAGYGCMAVQPVDMFPGTQHVETVVLMSKVQK